MTKAERAHEFIHRFRDQGTLDASINEHMGDELVQYFAGLAEMFLDDNPDAELIDLTLFAMTVGYLAGVNEEQSKAFRSRNGGFLA